MRESFDSSKGFPPLADVISSRQHGGSVKTLSTRCAFFAFLTVFATQVAVVCSQQNERAKPDTMSVVISKDSLRNQDLIQVLNSPTVIDNSVTLTVEYRCSRTRTTGVEITADTERRKSEKIYRKVWKCSGGKDSSVLHKNVHIHLAGKYAYRPDRYNPDIEILSRVVIRAWVIDSHRWSKLGLARKEPYKHAFVKVSYNTSVVSPYIRPPDQRICLSWSSSVFRMLDWSKIGFCPKEIETVEVVRYPAAFSGSFHGVFRHFDRYTDRNLEGQRTTQLPDFTVSMWVYILEYCPGARLCSLMHHFSRNDLFLSPLLCFNPEGKLHIQFMLRSGQPMAVLTPFVIPKLQWIHMVFSFRKKQWALDVEYGENFNKSLNTYLNIYEDVVYDDTEDIFTFGGSELMPSFKGYIGKATFYRNKAFYAGQLPRPSPYHPMFELGITARGERCQTYTSKIQHRIYQCRILKKIRDQEVSCPNFFDDIRVNQKLAAEGNQCPIWEAPRSKQYGIVNKLVKQLILSGQMVSRKDIGDAIYKKVVAKIDNSVESVPSVIRLLKQAACYDSYDAMYMLSVILNNGFWVKSDEIQSHAFLMLASLERHRLSMMSLASKHNLGLDGIPLDKEQAFMYYKYVAEQAREDREIHKDTDIVTESVRLTDELQMKEQTDEEGDIFMWMKHQAKQGVLGAQQYVARSLFWGSQGLQRNVQAALEYFRLGAEQQDPVSMYDYGIVLMRGQGTKKNVTKGLELMERSAERGNPNALSALGWHALEMEKNYTKAAAFLERAFKLGNPDAGHNLGHMYLTGKYPNHTVDKVICLSCFEWAAARHQFDAGVILSQFLIKGTDQLSPNTVMAVEWARFMAEKNPHIGHVLRKALKTYKEGNIPLALFYYLLAAESGIEVGNFNLAILCEENKEGIVTYVEKECQWHRFNISLQREEQHIDPYALIKMGDYHWYGCEGNRDADRAVDFYTRAALKRDPHAIFNLAFMVEEGVQLNEGVLRVLRVPRRAMRSNVTLLTELYSRCKESPKTEAYLPCSLALWRIQLLDVWTRYRMWMTVSSAIGITVVTSATLLSIYTYFKGLRNPATMTTGELTPDTV
ncbi:protein sel-1 homolog 3-like [Liolophura sinensis]|uniref:protein sel-1 homolog 3-like n=1 Tax=Liolophura sinensis TaxID=3198878 RepID=UPI00315933C1